MDGFGQNLYVVAWLAVVAVALPGLFGSYRGRLGTAVVHGLAWTTLLLALITGYAYRDTVAAVAARVSAELVPAGTGIDLPSSEGERAVRIRRSSRGPFLARAKVNGADTLMLVDTGASSVVLKTADAQAAGIDVAALRFEIAVDTANGTTFCAPVRLRSVSVGGIAYADVQALVAKPGDLKESLLGMSFLKRLRSYDFSGDFLTLRS